MPSVPRDEFVTSVSRLAESVYDFHSRFGTLDDLPPLPHDAMRKQLAFLVEETGEHAKDLNKGDLGNATLELSDVVFVALGGLLMMGDTGAKASHQVAQKNDDKTNATHHLEPSSGKLVKRPV